MRSKLANTHVRLKQSGPGKQVSQVQSHLQPSLDSFLLLLVGRLVDGEDDVAGLGLGSKRTFGRAKSGSIGDLFIKSAVPKQGGERANQEVLEDASSDRVSEELSDTNIGSLEHDISNIHVLLEKGMGDGERRLLSELGKGLERSSVHLDKDVQRTHQIPPLLPEVPHKALLNNSPYSDTVLQAIDTHTKGRIENEALRRVESGLDDSLDKVVDQAGNVVQRVKSDGDVKTQKVSSAGSVQQVKSRRRC